VYRLCFSLLLLLCASVCLSADAAADFNVALAQWRTAAVQDYVFTYRDIGAGLIAPYCAGAQIEVRVKRAVGLSAVVVRGQEKCPAGTRGRSIGLEVPKTIDDAFRAVRRYIFEPPTPVKVSVSYDPIYGYPLKYYVAKLEYSDSDEGFEISKFAASR
jgi:Family of unknown function (DUF6174)